MSLSIRKSDTVTLREQVALRQFAQLVRTLEQEVQLRRQRVAGASW